MKIRIIWAIIFCSLLSTASATGSNMIPDPKNTIIPFAGMDKRIASLSVKDIQKLIGRKLTLKERISFLILKQKLKHKPKESLNEGDISLIFGIAGLVFLALALLLTPYFMIASITSAIVAIVSGHRLRKKDPGNKKAKTAKLLGWITLGLIVAGFIIIIIAFASIGSWSFG